VSPTLFRISLIERLEERLKTRSFDELTCGGSKLRFAMSMAIAGDPFGDLPPLLTDAQFFDSDEFDSVVDDVFDTACEQHLWVN
jgi:hypothetical protein